MKRTTVKIPDELDARLRLEARRRSVTISEITREALESHLAPGGRREGARRHLSSAGTFDSGETDVSERIEEILQAEMDPRRS